MSRESKIITPTILGVQDTISHYESFGWELLSLNGQQITVSRETQNPVYTQLVKYQAQYEELEKEYKAVKDPVKPTAPAKFSLKNCALLLLLLIAPGVIYIVNKVKKNNLYKLAVEEYNQALSDAKNKRKEILAKMAQVALDSRAVFFSRQA